MFGMQFCSNGLYLAILYFASVRVGGDMIKFFSATNPVSTYTSLILVGGLILVITPFLDILILVVQVWRGKIKINEI